MKSILFYSESFSAAITPPPQINGNQLYGRSHVNAAPVIGRCREDVIKLVVQRHPHAMDMMAQSSMVPRVANGELLTSVSNDLEKKIKKAFRRGLLGPPTIHKLKCYASKPLQQFLKTAFRRSSPPRRPLSKGSWR